MLTDVARGSPPGTGRRSATMQSTPWRASSIAAVAPAGPAPAIRTGTSYFVFTRSASSVGTSVHGLPGAGSHSRRC